MTAAATIDPALPRWDMTPIFPGLASPEFRAARDALVRDIAALVSLFDAHGVGRRDPAPLDAATVRAVEEIVARYNTVQEAVRVVLAYVWCFVSTDSRDAVAQAALSDLQTQTVPLAQLDARLTAWIGSLDVETLIERSAIARDHAYPLRQAKRAAVHQMSPAEEALAAELAPSGGSAWSKLHADVSSQITVRLELDGEERELPLSEVENLAFHADRDVRRRAYEAELAAWQAHATPVAAALNAVKGETNTLVARRGWDDPLDPALVLNRIDRPTLDAFQTAVHEAFPDFRRYLRAKARALGLPILAWYDLGAPVGAHRPWPFEDATAFVVDRFVAFSPKLGALAERAFRERWVDAEPRDGKGGGAMCIPVGQGASRVFANYVAAFDGVNALAHELGHAYHVAVLGEYRRTPLQDPFPGALTLAETASTFCETFVGRAARAQADEAEELAILDGALLSLHYNVVGPSFMFAIERDIFAARRRRELSVAELNALTEQAEREVFADALAPDTLHPFLWARLPHFFIPDVWYYSFPYTFGLLFGLGLFARFEADPDAFRAGFDDLLSLTGMADAADLAARFAIDLHAPAFWRASLDLIRADIARYEHLVARHSAPSATSGQASSA